ncbi:MAG: 16S rRNA (guanine(527)-N(7))-methyltransferase RsmG [Clostridia bacterium]|nr:16S rRNA (guanine(527)-N(7))-methyltransferase RsmG [Clostridia bacterium]
MNTEQIKKLIYEENRDKFDRFFSLLTKYNEKFNLTAIKEEKEVFEKHFLDSATGIFLLPKGAKCIEIGSGGGFPSMVLKLLRDDLTFTLVESVGKKCEFLRVIVDNFSLQGVDILNTRAETLAKEENHREKYDVAVARAVARMNTLSEYLLPFVKVGGMMVAYKGEREEIDEAQNAIKTLGGALREVIPYRVEGADNHCLVVVDKIKRTPPLYPRGNGKERSKPL